MYCKRFCFVAAAAVALAAMPALGGKPSGPSYQIVALDDGGGVFPGGAALDVNDQRLVVGEVEDPLGGYLAACWTTSEAGGEVQSDLHLLAGGTYTRGINQRGEIVGGGRPSGQLVGLFWATKDDPPLELSPLEGDETSVAEDINKDGVICGFSQRQLYDELGEPAGWAATAVAWRVNIDPGTGNRVIWGPVALPTIDESAAFGINDTADGLAEIVGYLFGASRTAVVWTVQSLGNGELSVDLDVEILPGNESDAYGVNDLVAICGVSAGEAVVWEGASLQVLDRSRWVWSAVAYDINDNGVIVGRGLYKKQTGAERLRAVVWPSANGSMILLDEFLDRDSPFLDLSGAGGVNEAGDIVGWGSLGANSGRAFLAIPE